MKGYSTASLKDIARSVSSDVLELNAGVLADEIVVCVTPVKRVVPTEYDEQVALFAWIVANTERYPCLALAFHPANGEYRLPATAGRLKAMGVRAGVPDVVMGVPAYLFDSHKRYAGCAIELKRSDHSNGPTPEQLAWLARLEHYGWYCSVAYGAGQAIDCLRWYVEMVEEV